MFEWVFLLDLWFNIYWQWLTRVKKMAKSLSLPFHLTEELFLSLFAMLPNSSYQNKDRAAALKGREYLKHVMYQCEENVG